MEFLDSLKGALEVAQKLAELWPVLAIGITIVPVVTNLIKWVAAKIGQTIDGYSAYIKYALNLVAFTVYFYAAAQGIDVLQWEPVMIAVGTVLVALASWLGANGVQARFLYPLSKRLPGALGFSYSK